MHKFITWGKRVLEIEKRGIQNVSDQLGESFVGAAETCLETLRRKGKIVVVGVGKSGNVGVKIAATLNSTGAPAVVLDSQNALHGDIGLIGEHDTVLAMSYSGETQELLTLLPYITLRGVKIIAITRAPNSTLGKHADFVIDSSVEEEACPLKLAPTASSTSTLALGDALAMVLLEAQDFTAQDFAKCHPSGALGKALLMKAEDLMRSISAVPIVQEQDCVQYALEKMSELRAGACVILDSKEQLVGVFTHGDFVRAYQRDYDIGQAILSDVMTRDPITINFNTLASEVVKIFKQHNIDDLIVIGNRGEVKGMVDSQDLNREKYFFD